MDYKERGDGGIIFQTFLQPLENKVCSKRLTVPIKIFTKCVIIVQWGRGEGVGDTYTTPPP